MGNSVGRLREDLRRAQRACAQERAAHEETQRALANARARLAVAQSAQREAEKSAASTRREAQRLRRDLDTAIAQKQVLAEQIGDERAKRREADRALQEGRRKPREAVVIQRVPATVKGEIAALRNEIEVLRSQLAEAQR